jgi:hypothetical protein
VQRAELGVGLTVKVGVSTATEVDDSTVVEELSSLSTFCSSAKTPPDRKATPAAAAAMLNLILNAERCLNSLCNPSWGNE